MTRSYALSLAAEADLREIIRYTRERWGDAQARVYAEQLERCAERVAAGGPTCKDVSALHPGLRTMRCERHQIFCLPRDDEPALIVAFFHERMDLMARVASRLA